jgi:hypothetical protein
VEVRDAGESGTRVECFVGWPLASLPRFLPNSAPLSSNNPMKTEKESNHTLMRPRPSFNSEHGAHACSLPRAKSALSPPSRPAPVTMPFGYPAHPWIGALCNQREATCYLLKLERPSSGPHQTHSPIVVPFSQAPQPDRMSRPGIAIFSHFHLAAC